jgi:hypothetical protein
MPKKSAKKGLQKLTESQQKVANLFKLSIVTYESLEDFSDDERKLLGETLTNKCDKATPEEKERLVNQFEAVLSPVTKHEVWENNHNCITSSISNLMQEKRRMPSVTEIATASKLSRQTVYKHLKEYKTSPVYLEQVQKFEFMTHKILTNLFIYAINGDVAAAKVCLSAFGKLEQGQGNNTLIQQQNNFVQINGAIISQDKISRLNQNQLERLEGLLSEFIFSQA